MPKPSKSQMSTSYISNIGIELLIVNTKGAQCPEMLIHIFTPVLLCETCYRLLQWSKESNFHYVKGACRTNAACNFQ